VYRRGDRKMGEKRMTAERLEELKVKIAKWETWGHRSTKLDAMKELVKEIETQWMKKD
jgi:hypothetical protein